MHEINRTLNQYHAINIQFTSGTTGMPKGAALSHYNIVNNARYVTDRINLTDFHRLDRALGLEGKSATPGAESIHADAASSDSYGTASCKQRNLAGVEVPKSMFQRRGVRIGQEIQAFDREGAEERCPRRRGFCRGSAAPEFR